MVVRDTIQCGCSREIQVSFSLGVYRKPLNNGTCVTHHPLKDIFTILAFHIFV